MGDAGVMGGAAADTMTLSGIQTSTGAKTFNDQKLIRKNPAGTFSLTEVHPAITANKDRRFYQPYNMMVRQEGSNYYVINGLTDAVESSSSSAITSLQAANDALTAGRTWKEKILFIGDYSAVSVSLILDSNTILEVIGRLKLANSANVPIIKNRSGTASEGSQDHDIELIGGEYDGNKANQGSGFLINFFTANHLKFKGIRSHDAKFDALTLQGCDDVTIEDCYFYNCDAMGLRATGNTTYGAGAKDLRVVNCHATGNAINGLWAQGSNATYQYFNVTMVGNTCRDNTVSGIYIDWNVLGFTVAGNSCESNGNSVGTGGGGGIVVNGQANGVPYYGTGPGEVVGNACHASDEDGIFVQWSKNIKVSDNFVSNAQWHGIGSQANKQCQFTDNTCLNNGQKTANTYSGILLYDATGSDTFNYPQLDCLFQGNTCYDDQGTKTQKYGIAQQGFGYRNIIRNNNVKGNNTGGMLITDFSNCYDNEGFRIKAGRYNASSISDSSTGMLQGLVRSFTNGGTIIPTLSSAGLVMTYTTSATINDLTGGRIGNITERDLTPCFKTKFKLSQTTSTRFVLGLTSNADNQPTTSNNPLASRTGVILYYDSSQSANWRIHFNNGNASIVSRDTGIAANTNAHEFSVFINNNGTGFMIVMLDDVLVTTAPEISQIPNAATTMGLYWYVENIAAATKAFQLWDLELRHVD